MKKSLTEISRWALAMVAAVATARGARREDAGAGDSSSTIAAAAERAERFGSETSTPLSFDSGTGSRNESSSWGAFAFFDFFSYRNLSFC